MTNTASQPPAIIGQGSVNRPMMRGLTATTIITAISGADNTPLTTALQNNALIGSSDVKFSAAPPRVVTAMVA